MDQLEEGEEPFYEDYRIAEFLDLKDWRTVEWDKKLLRFYQKAFECFKRFWTGRDPLRKFRLLVTPEMDGDRDHKKKLFPYELVKMMCKTPSIKKIVEFEKMVDQVGEDAAFDAYERDYLGKHWKMLVTENDPRTLCALALIWQRLSIVHGIQGVKFEQCWTRVQYEYSYYSYYDNGTSPISPSSPIHAIGGEYALYFWFQNAWDSNWRPKAATQERLLQCHKMTAEEADKLVQDFLKGDTKS